MVALFNDRNTRLMSLPQVAVWQLKRSLGCLLASTSIRVIFLR